MKDIASRVTNLEQRVGRVRHERANAGADADFVRLMSDEAGREAVIAFSNYMRAHHPEGPGQRANVASDPRVGPLFDAVVLAAQRANAGRWLATWGVGLR